MGIRNLRLQTEDLTRQVNGLRHERRERESTLVEKEKKIAEYKQKVATLKKFKHVLDFRLREVNESLQPKEFQISELKAQLRELEGEFEKQLGEQRSMEGIIGQKDQKLSWVSNECKGLRDEVAVRDKTIQSFTTDLDNLVHSGMDQREWPAAIKRLYQEHVRGETVEKPPSDIQSTEELERQMRLMER